MKGTIAEFFPSLQEHAGDLYDIMTAFSVLLVTAGLMMAVSQGRGDPATIIRSVLAAGFIGIAVAFYPDWANLAQSLAQGVVDEMGADPGEAHEKFASLVAGSSDGDGQKTGFWDVLFGRDGGIGQAVLYAGIFLMGKIASAVQFLFFVVQQALVQLQIGFAPIFLAFFLAGPLRPVAVGFQTAFVSLLLWPVGWAVASLMTDALLELAAGSGVYKSAAGVVLGGPQTMFFLIVLTLWTTLSTIGAPLVIHKLLTTGANAGSALLSSVGLGTAQSAVYGTSAGATVAMSGGSPGLAAASAVAAGVGGAAGGGLGRPGVLVPSAVGVGAALALSASGGPPDYTAMAQEHSRRARR